MLTNLISLALVLSLFVPLTGQRGFSTTAYAQKAEKIAKAPTTDSRERKMPKDLLAIVDNSNGNLTQNVIVQTSAPLDALNFWADGRRADTLSMAGNTIFSASALAIWGNALIDPTSMASGVTAEKYELMGGNDDTAISGLRFIDSASQYFPK